MDSLDSTALIAFTCGVVILLTAWLPLLLRKLPLSLPIIAVGAGYAAFSTPWLHFDVASLRENHVFERIVEFVLIIALMGAGLRVARPLRWRSWSATIRLLVVGMPLMILAATAVGTYWLGLSLASSLLLAAALSPTDPVLAADVQAGPPGEDEGGEVRFALTSEAGLNDGLAFPFVLLAMALAKASWGTVWTSWLVVDVAWRVLCGLAVGVAAGSAFGWLTFRLPRLKLSSTGDGLIAVGVTLVSYGLCQLLHGYGFIAVFVSAVMLRATDRGNDFHVAMAEFSEQIERALMVGVLILFGGALAYGLLSSLQWLDLIAVTVIVFLLRPLTAWIALIGTGYPPAAKALMAFFGIRGLGTIYYLIFALGDGRFPDAPRIWAAAGVAVLMSVVIHGVSATPLMAWADRRRAAHRRSGRADRAEPQGDTTLPEAGSAEPAA